MNTPIIFKQIAGVAVLTTALTSVVMASTFDFDNENLGAIEDSVAGFKAYNTNGGDLIAEISSDMAFSGSQSLKLVDDSTSNKPFARTEFSTGEAYEGSVSTMVYIPSGNVKSTYIAIGTGKNNSDRYFEVKLSASGTVQYENGSDDPKVGKVSLDEWHKFDLSWAEGVFSVVIDGEQLVDEAIVLNADQIPTGVTFYTGDKANAGNIAYFDDLTSDLF